MDMIESAGEVKLTDEHELEIFLATIRLARTAAKYLFLSHLEKLGSWLGRPVLPTMLV